MCANRVNIYIRLRIHLKLPGNARRTETGAHVRKMVQHVLVTVVLLPIHTETVVILAMSILLTQNVKKAVALHVSIMMIVHLGDPTVSKMGVIWHRMEPIIKVIAVLKMILILAPLHRHAMTRPIVIHQTPIAARMGFAAPRPILAVLLHLIAMTQPIVIHRIPIAMGGNVVPLPIIARSHATTQTIAIQGTPIASTGFVVRIQRPRRRRPSR